MDDNDVQEEFEINVVNWLSGPALKLDLHCNDCEGSSSGKKLISLKNRVMQQ